MRRGHLFIVGLARTGSTVLVHALNASPYVWVASETQYFQRSRDLRLLGRLEAAQRGVDGAMEGLLDDLYGPRFWSLIRRRVDRDELRRRLLAVEPTDQAVFELLLDLCVEANRPGASEDLIVGDKTPAHLRNVDVLLRWYPDAKVIHTFRDPRAVYASSLRRVREGRWGPRAAMPWIPAPVIDPMLAPFEVVRTTIAWLDAVRRHRALAARLGDRYRLVRFEDLVIRPEPVLRDLANFLDIPFDEAMLQDVRVVGSSYDTRKLGANGFDPGTAERWRSEVNGSTTRWFRLVAGREMARFGYHDA